MHLGAILYFGFIHLYLILFYFILFSSYDIGFFVHFQ